MSTTILTPLDTAISYASRGWPVFPCRSRETYDDLTGEVFSAKTPLTSNGLRGASLNERIVREWWRRTPDAMVGVPTGKPIDAWVLDLDIKPGVGDGHEWLAAMEAEHGSLPATARARTMGGGTHVFFRHVDGVRNRGKLGLCVDVRGDGGYVIAPGSIADGGRGYEWINDAPIADAPQWLLDLVLPPPVTHTRHDYTYTPGGNEPYVERAVQAELDTLAGAPQGGRGGQVNASAFSLGQFVGAGALSRAEAEDGLWQAAVACGVVGKDGEREIRNKIRRGLDAGMRQPREIPERQTDQDNTRLVDISRMIANGLAKGSRPKDTEREHSSEKQNGDSEIIPSGNSAHTTQENPSVVQERVVQPPAIAQQQPPIVATRFSWIDPKTLRRREFAYGTHYIRKFVSVTVSPGGLGKTSNSIVEALSMTSGRPLIGTKPPQRTRVWLFNAEDPRDEMERRIMAACIHYKLKPEDIEDYLFLDTGREQELVVAIDDKRAGVRIVEPIVESIVHEIQRNRVDVLIVDPFVSTHRVSENDNGAIDKVAKLWAQVADYTNCAIDVVHHLRKVSDREATVEDARGAVSLIGAARSVRVLNRMSEDEATQANVDDRFSYFNVHQGKANLTKISANREWRRMVSVPLGNGQGLMKPQDHAGVVTEWHWPTAEDVVSEITEEQMSNIRAVLGNGSYKKAPQGRPWAGEAIAYVLGLDTTESANKKRVSGILRSLLHEGKLVVVEERDPMSRQTASFVRAPDVQF